MKENKIAIYKSDNSIQLEVLMENETVWLTQAQIADLFGVKRPAITKHLNNIYKSEELDEKSTCSILEHMGNDTKQTYQTKYYNLDAILSVGYRVNTRKGTQFRIWATQILKAYLIEGYVMNEKVLQEKNRELINQLQILSVLIINKIPLPEKTIIEMLTSHSKK